MKNRKFSFVVLSFFIFLTTKGNKIQKDEPIARQEHRFLLSEIFLNQNWELAGKSYQKMKFVFSGVLKSDNLTKIDKSSCFGEFIGNGFIFISKIKKAGYGNFSTTGKIDQPITKFNQKYTFVPNANFDGYFDSLIHFDCSELINLKPENLSVFDFKTQVIDFLLSFNRKYNNIFIDYHEIREIVKRFEKIGLSNSQAISSVRFALKNIAKPLNISIKIDKNSHDIQTIAHELIQFFGKSKNHIIPFNLIIKEKNQLLQKSLEKKFLSAINKIDKNILQIDCLNIDESNFQYFPKNIKGLIYHNYDGINTENGILWETLLSYLINMNIKELFLFKFELKNFKYNKTKEKFHRNLKRLTVSFHNFLSTKAEIENINLFLKNFENLNELTLIFQNVINSDTKIILPENVRKLSILSAKNYGNLNIDENNNVSELNFKSAIAQKNDIKNLKQATKGLKKLEIVNISNVIPDNKNVFDINNKINDILFVFTNDNYYKNLNTLIVNEMKFKRLTI